MRFSSSSIFVLALGTSLALTVACSDSSSSSSSSSSSGTGSSGTTSSSGTTTSSGGSSGGSSGTTSSGGSSGAVADAGPGGCGTAFLDRSADTATREIQWNLSVASTPEHCMKIKVGQKVKWVGDFASHPLTASTTGGSSPNNPIASVDTTTGEVTFAAAGTYPFVCGIHPSMSGAIEVVE